jgi:hypothetical protein
MHGGLNLLSGLSLGWHCVCGGELFSHVNSTKIDPLPEHAFHGESVELTVNYSKSQKNRSLDKITAHPNGYLARSFIGTASPDATQLY